MRTRRMVMAGLVVGAMALAACGGSDDTPAQPAGDDEAGPSAGATVVTSDDGNLTLTVPAGAMPEGTEITITPTDPAALALGEGEPIGAAYDLQPDGLQFEEPVQVQRRFAAAELADGDDDVVPATLIISDGGVEFAAEQSTEIGDGDERVHTFEIEHFSTVVTVDTWLRLVVSPINAGSVRVSDTFDVTAVWNQVPRGIEVTDESDDEEKEFEFDFRFSVLIRPVPMDMLTVTFEEWEGDSQGGVKRATLRCEKPGTGRVNVPIIANGIFSDADWSFFLEALALSAEPRLREKPLLGMYQDIPITCVGDDDGGTAGESDDDDSGGSGDEGSEGDGGDGEPAVTANGTPIPFGCDPLSVRQTIRLPDPLDAGVEIVVRDASPEYTAQLAQPHTVVLQVTRRGPVIRLDGGDDGNGLSAEFVGGPEGPAIEPLGYNTLDGRIEQAYDEVVFGDGFITLVGTAQLSDELSSPFDLDVVLSDSDAAAIFDTAFDLWDLEPEEVVVDLWVLDRGDSIAVEGLDATPCTEFELFVFVEGVGPQRAMVVSDTGGYFVQEGFDRPEGSIKLKSLAAFAVHDGEQVADAFGDKTSSDS